MLFVSVAGVHKSYTNCLASRVRAPSVSVSYPHCLDKAPLFFLNPWGGPRSKIKSAEGKVVVCQKCRSQPWKASPCLTARDKANICILFSLSLLVYINCMRQWVSLFSSMYRLYSHPYTFQSDSSERKQAMSVSLRGAQWCYSTPSTYLQMTKFCSSSCLNKSHCVGK